MTLLSSLFLVALGGAVGSVARFLSVSAATRLLGAGFPYGTLLVNIAGSLLMGVLAGILAQRSEPASSLHLLLAVGVLGGFTTFSAFSLDAVILLQRGEHVAAAFYIAGSVLVSLLALLLGLWLVRLAA
jgi:fluoride exporter